PIPRPSRRSAGRRPAVGGAESIGVAGRGLLGAEGPLEHVVDLAALDQGAVESGPLEARPVEAGPRPGRAAETRPAQPLASLTPPTELVSHGRRGSPAPWPLRPSNLRPPRRALYIPDESSQCWTIAPSRSGRRTSPEAPARCNRSTNCHDARAPTG